MEEKRFRFEKGCAITDPSFAVDTKWFCQTWGHEYKYEEGIIEDVMMNVNIPNGGMFITRNLEPNKTKFIKCDDTLAIFNLGSEHFTDQYIKERLHEDNYILFEGSGWGFIKNVDDLYVSIQLEFDDGRSQDFTIELTDDCIDGVDDMIIKRLSNIMEYSDAQAIAYAICDEVLEDVKETADQHNWNSADVDIALVRVLKKKLGIEE